METVFGPLLFDKLAGSVRSPFQQPNRPDALEETGNPKSLRKRQIEPETKAPETELDIFEVLLPQAKHILDSDVSDILPDDFVLGDFPGVLGLHHHHNHAGVRRDFDELHQSADQKAQVLLPDDLLQRIPDAHKHHGNLFEFALFERQRLRPNTQRSCSILDSRTATNSRTHTPQN